MKMPTYKELGFNIKKELWKRRPKTFKEWQDEFQPLFLVYLRNYLIKTNQNTQQLFKQHYQILFYFSFINFRRELELSEKLEQKGYEIKLPNLLQDGIFKIDLIANNESKTYYFQIKNQEKLLSIKDKNTLIKVANLNAATPILATKKGKEWEFKNLKNNQKEVIL